MAMNRNGAATDGMSTGSVSDVVVQKVGAALGQISQIRENYAEQYASVDTDEQKRAVEAEAQMVMVEAVNQQGLSVEQFNDVVTAAEADPELGQRVLAAAKAA
jgi:hypothetical protein